MLHCCPWPALGTQDDAAATTTNTGVLELLPSAQDRLWLSALAAVLGGGHGADPYPKATALAQVGAVSSASSLLCTRGLSECSTLNPPL